MGERNIHLDDMLATLGSSVRECLTIIDKHGVATVFVVDESGRLAGVVGEREIRKALVGGAELDDAVAAFVDPPTATSTPRDGRAEVLDVMRALRVGEVPIVDGEGRIVGVHRDSEIVGSFPLENWAVVMAGGRGTRLAPLTDDIPKPMLPVAGRPILERIVLHLVGSGIRRLFLSVNYLGSLVEQYFGDGSKYGCDIEYLRETPDRPLGTGGALGLLGDLGETPAAPVLVMNGDLVTAFPVTELLAAHAESGAVATIATSTYEHQVPFGVLESRSGRLMRIVEKPRPSWPVNAGIYVVSPMLLGRVPRGEMYPITNLFEHCLSRGEAVGLWPIRDQWQDIGRPHELAQARGIGERTR
ncbi:sugar phosphate nucleotidyltransferase [Jiangella asiatica]|nr:sugar phosphate nucleotidyltransferase [Jiangella asiatica]